MTSRSARLSILAATAVFAVFIVQSNAQDVGTGTFTITTPATLTTGMCGTDVDVTFNLNVCEVGGTTDASISEVKLYYTNDANFDTPGMSYTGVDATLSPVLPLAVLAGAGASTTAATATLTADAATCSTYTHICVVVTDTSDSVATNDDSCIAIDGGTISTSNCAGDIKATTLTVTIPDPTSGGFTEGTAVATTLTLAYTVTGYGGSPSDVKIYFSNADGSTTSAEATAGGSAPDGSLITADGSYTGLTASLTLDTANCVAYTKLCASITVTDDDANNNEACAEFGTATSNAGTKTCNDDIAASLLTVTVPDPTSGGFTEGTAVATTFTLAYTVTGTGGTPSDVKIYFSNADGSTTSGEVTAGSANAPSGSTAITADGSFVDLTATLTLDTANCLAYTKLCASITVTDDDDTNNEACADFGITTSSAGTKTCTSDDIAALTFTVTSPAPATGIFRVDEAVSTTFTLAYAVSGDGGSPIDVKVYFSNADGSTKSTEVTATGSNAPGGTAATASGSYADLVASLTIDATNCDAYTAVCGSITVTDDVAENNAACADFGTTAAQAGTKNCTADAGSAGHMTVTSRIELFITIATAFLCIFK